MDDLSNEEQAALDAIVDFEDLLNGDVTTEELLRQGIDAAEIGDTAGVEEIIADIEQEIEREREAFEEAMNLPRDGVFQDES